MSFVVEDPPEQFHPNSLVHVELQPSLLEVLPSSQYVGNTLNLMPSPQISTQVSAVVVVPPEQAQPVSLRHDELHPSPLKTLPSSQNVLAELYFLPSPQISLQLSFDVDVPPNQFQPDSICQIELHPSLLMILPSSQYVAIELKRLASPQISDHMSLVVEVPPVQVHPDSTAHTELHPSLFTVLPSSQNVLNEVYFLPSPQMSLQISLDVEVPPEQVHPVSFVHKELQPSPFIVFPSSQ